MENQHGNAEKRESKLWLGLLLGAYLVIFYLLFTNLVASYTVFKTMQLTMGPKTLFINWFVQYPGLTIPFLCLVTLVTYIMYDRYNEIKSPYNMLALTVFIMFFNISLYFSADLYSRAQTTCLHCLLRQYEIYQWLWGWF